MTTLLDQPTTTTTPAEQLWFGTRKTLSPDQKA